MTQVHLPPSGTGGLSNTSLDWSRWPNSWRSQCQLPAGICLEPVPRRLWLRLVSTSLPLSWVISGAHTRMSGYDVGSTVPGNFSADVHRRSCWAAIGNPMTRGRGKCASWPPHVDRRLRRSRKAIEPDTVRTRPRGRSSGFRKETGRGETAHGRTSDALPPRQIVILMPLCKAACRTSASKVSSRPRRWLDTAKSDSCTRSPKKT